MSEPLRILFDPGTGERYRVRIAPRELMGRRGINPLLNSVVFGTEVGGWVGTAPVSTPVTLQDLSEGKLRKMLGRAIRRGL